jgi:hypothetical protein
MDRIFLVRKGTALAGPNLFADADEALRALHRAALDYDNLQHFRDIWAEINHGAGLNSPGDRAILAHLADRLAAGVLRQALKRRPDLAAGGRTPRGGATAPPPPPAAAPAKPGPPPLKLRPPTLPPEIAKAVDQVQDLAQQAECLIDAARDGLPFCELCAK